MKIDFYKYQGTGNDFVILDNSTNQYDNLSSTQIEKICNRRFGIGADGLMMLNQKPGFDFEMIYFNADGKPGSMCGNGGRCLVKFAYDKGIRKFSYRFIASDGPHEAEIVNFVESTGEDSIYVRTYERGVEEETFSCGTGVTAASLMSAHNERGFNRVEVKTLGGNLSVEFNKISKDSFQDIWLCGPATFVYKGEIDI